MNPRRSRRIALAALAAYALAALAGRELHLLTHHGQERHEASRSVAHDCGCGHCHLGPQLAHRHAPHEHEHHEADATGDQRIVVHAHDCSDAGHADDCAVCASLASLRLARCLAESPELPAAEAAPAYHAADSLDVPHVVFSADARGPPVC